MTVINLWGGGLTHDGLRVNAKLTGVTSAQLAVDTDPHFGNPTMFGPDTPTAQGVVDIAASALDPGSTYFYAIEEDGNLAPGGLVTDGTSGDYATTPDDASLDIIGDLDVRAEVTIDDWTAAAPDGVRATLLGKWVTTGGQRSYFLGVENDGRLSLFWSTTGANSVLPMSTVSVPITSGKLAVRATLDADNGAAGNDVTFYTADAITGSWTQLGSVVTTAGATTIFSGTAEASLAAVDGGTGRPFAGTIHAAEIRNGIDGVVVTDPFPALAPIDAASFTDTTGKTWTVQGTAQIFSTTGQFRTAPAPAGSVGSFSFIASGDAGLSPDFPDTTGNVLATDRVSNAPTFDTIREHPSGPLFFLHAGDLHYYDLGSGSHGITGGGSLANYRRAFDDVLLQSRQHELYHNMPLVYMWDDHDYGPNNSDGTLSTKQNGADVYRERVPSYSLDDSGAIYHSFQIGRVLFVVWDCRFYRSPNSDPDGPSKTMLGAAQKVWFTNLLNTSTADALVVVSSIRWINGGSDSWPGFMTERQELADLLISTGWSDRMVMMNADIHANAFDSGANNLWGGFPVYVVGSIDATPFDPGAGSYDVGASQSRTQYGTFSVNDSGASITITAQAYTAAAATFSHQLVIDTGPEPPEPPPPEPGLPTIAVSEIRTEVTWLSCDLATGRIIAELPNLVGQVSRVLGAYTSSSLRLPIPTVGHSGLSLIQKAALVEQLSTPAETMLVAVVNNVPIWAGIPLVRRGGTPAQAEFSAVSLEGYFRRRFVRDHSWTQQDESSVILTGLVEDAQDIPGVGVGISLLVDAPATGTLRTRTYHYSDHATVYERLRELMGVIEGPEWTIDIDWTDTTETAVAKIFRARKRIGITEESPPAVFQTTEQSIFSSIGSSNAIYTYTEDRTEGRYGNYQVAYAVGEGDDQPVSDPAIDTVALAAGKPIFERHWMPSSSITQVGTLNDHAAAGLDRLANGTNVFKIDAVWSQYPRYGVDWKIGDDIGWDLTGHRHPAGTVGKGRCIGFELDMQAGTIAPLLLTPGREVVTDDGN
jgi:phosphodiesterase/alkaline phosphatase D-like protein